MSLILILFLSLWGVYAEGSMDSRLTSENAASCSVTIRKISGGQAQETFCEKRLLEQTEGLMPDRREGRGTDVRAGRCLAFFLLLEILLCETVGENISFIRFAPDSNRCDRRILEYIHHKDGKKA